MALGGESQVHQLVKSKTSQRHLIGRPSVPPIEGQAAGLVRLDPKNQKNHHRERYDRIFEDAL